MTEITNKIGRVGWRWTSWDRVLTEVNNEERFPALTTYILLERTEHIEFTTKADAVTKDLFGQYWECGHCFNVDWELQFERTPNGFLLRLLSEDSLPEGWQKEEFDVGSEISLVLFGERKRDDEPGWREARIPRWLEYPIPKTKGRVRLIALPYLKDGVVVRMRWKGVEADETAT